MKKLVDSIEIRPSKGGHLVRTHFKPQASHTKGLGLSMDHTPPAERIFGTAEGQKMLAHIGAALGLAGAAGPAATPQAAGGAGAPAEDEATP